MDSMKITNSKFSNNIQFGEDANNQINFDDEYSYQNEVSVFSDDEMNEIQDRPIQIDGEMIFPEFEERSMDTETYSEAIQLKADIEKFEKNPEVYQQELDKLNSEMEELKKEYKELNEKLEKMNPNSVAYNKTKLSLAKLTRTMGFKKLNIIYLEEKNENFKKNFEKNKERLNQIIDDMEIANFEDIKTCFELSNSADKVYEKTVNSMAENKNNQQYVSNLVDSILNDFSSNYDYSLTITGIEGSNPEKLMKFIEREDNKILSGAICESMHGLVADMLTEAEIPATVISGMQDTDDTNKHAMGHATLLYKVGDKYVWNNYEESKTYEADNIEDAYKQISKEDNGFTSKGYLGLKSNNGSFKKVLYTEEAAFGEKLDKSSTDNTNLFDKTNLKDDNSLTFSTKGFNLTKTNEKNNTETGSTINQGSYSAEIKTSKNTKSFDNATSIGLDADLTKQINKGTNSLTLNADSTLSAIMDAKMTQYYGAIDASITDKKQFAKTENSKYSVLGSFGTHGNFTANSKAKTFVNDGDLRITDEIGIESEYKNDKLELTNQVSVGMPLDLNQKEYDQSITGHNFAAGINFKGASKLNYSPTENLNFSADINGFYSHTPHFNHSGYNAEIGANYKTDNTNLFGKIGVEQEKEQLAINKFDETIKNETELTSSFGFEKKNTTVEGNVNYNLNTKKTKGSVSAKIKF
ncbi:MAG: hypothetical protein MJ229_04420 [bacterium]|nr:hypothetical protein [bacterium]